MKEFDIELAKQGYPVVDQNGNDVEIVCYDNDKNTELPIVAIFNSYQSYIKYKVGFFNERGEISEKNLSSQPVIKLFMKTKKAWFNYFCSTYESIKNIVIASEMYYSEEEALANTNPPYKGYEYVCTQSVDFFDRNIDK